MLERGSEEIPRYVAFLSDPWPLNEHDGPFAAVSDLYELRSVARAPRGLEVVVVDEQVAGFTRVEAKQEQATGESG